MSLATFTKVVKSYNENGLGGAVRAMFSKDDADKTVRLTAADVGIFTTIERRLARTQLATMAGSSSSKTQEFNNQLIGFTMALEAMRKHVMSKNGKSRSYAIHLTFSDSLATTPYFKLAAKSTVSGEYHMTAIIRGLT